MKWSLVAALALLGSSHLALAQGACPKAHHRLKMSELPAGVANSIRAEANGAKVEELQCKTLPDGKIQYQAEVVRKDKAVDLQLDSVGIVTSRHEHSEQEEHINKP